MSNKIVKIKVDDSFYAPNSYGVRVFDDEITASLPYSKCKEDDLEENVFHVPLWLVIKNNLEPYIVED